MNYETFMKEKDRIAELPDEEQKRFYEKVLEEEKEESSVKLLAYFQYAVLFYYEGDFRKAREILERFAISYQSYEYIPEMISAFNLMGVASQCEGEYVLSRYYYTLALKVVQEKKTAKYYAYEYNNIALTYIGEQNYEEAYRYIQMAEEVLPESDRKIGAFIYLNKSDIFCHLGRMKEAVEAYDYCIREYAGVEILPDDILICAVSMYHAMGDREKYEEYIGKVLDKLGSMYASEFIDACKVVFDCSLEDGNYDLVEKVIRKMDSYMETHPHENRVGLKVEALKYEYAKKLGNQEEELKALERKGCYYEKIVSILEHQRTTSMDEYLETHKHLQEAVHNEMQANKAKTQFLTNMSHDIRTPMNAIVGITNLMEHALHNPEKLEGYLSKMQLSNRYMLGIINDLLDMNKIESGTTELHPEPMRLAEQIMQTQDIVRHQIAERGQELEVRTSHVCHENLIADPVRLRQIMVNVLSNAVKYTPDGGKIAFSIEELPAGMPEKASFLFTIKDNGIGMDEELLSHIFDPFIRGEDSVVNKIQGTGLGMAIVKSIVDLMDGTIEIESRVNEGSCVKIHLNLTIDREEDAKMEPLKLLFLSRDEALIRDLTVSGRQKPVSLTCVSGEDEAEEFLEKEEPDVVLLDVAFSGADVVQRLRCQTKPSVLFLGLDDPKDENRWRQTDVSGKLSRPFFFTDVEKEVNRIRSSAEETRSESILNGMHFLCAEDNELNAEILAASLEIAGASCRVCPDGEALVEAFEKVKPGEYDAILMDIQMPNKNGYEAARLIRSGENELGRSIPIIAMTANAFVEDVNNSLAAGMNAHISKPLDMAVLESTMRRLKNTQNG